MSRIFSLLAAISTLLILLAGASAYWFSLAETNQAKQDTTRVLAERLAMHISSQLSTLQQSLDGIAQLPEVRTALERGDQESLMLTAAKLEILLPEILRLRILPRNISEPDQTLLPHMGYADLEMAQATLKDRQMPGIQGEGQDRHLALTSLVSRDGEAIGILLASLEPSYISTSINPSNIREGWFEVRQQKTVLLAAGNQEDKSDTGQSLRIPHSSWTIGYWPIRKSDNSAFMLIGSSTVLCGLLACLAFFIGYRKLANYLRQDQSSIIKITKDLLSGKMAGNYPVQLHEMKAIISTLVQYKRVLEKQVNSSDETDKEFGYALLDEGLDDDLLTFNDDIGLDTLSAQPDTGQPIDMPDEAFTQEPPALAGTSEANKSTPDLGSIFKNYDIRGIVDQTLTPDIAFKIGQALGTEAKSMDIKTLVVGRDGRISSRSLATALMEGINATGLDVLDIGMVPTPVLYFVAHHLEGRSGAVITGSHNPANYNGVKIVLKGETLSGDKIQQLKQRIDNADFATGATGSIEQNTLFTNEYIGILSEDIHIARPMKIVLDCGNGAAGELAPVVLKTIGCEVIELYCEVDGHFPNHHPDPSKPENLTDLITAVKHYRADVGIALDGDGDRLGVVDCNGNIIWPDRQMMLFAKDVLSGKPGAEIIFDVKCSRHLGEQISKLGGRPLMWKTGHSLQKAKLKETGAALAGEMSGHIIFNDRWFGFDDGLYAAARMIEILSSDSRPSNDVFAALPDSVNTPELTVEVAEGENTHLIEQLFGIANFKDGKIVNIDGLRVDFADGWGLVRASNTLPALVLRFEADTPQALSRIQKQFKQLLLQIKPDLSLPF